MNTPRRLLKILPSLAALSVAPFLLSRAGAAPAVAPPVSKPLPAFPGAQGFGALATGGRGGTVVHVTNLDDSGPGSFREAVSQSNRIVVFDVGGVIPAQTAIKIASNITVAGQTAPGEGITIYGNVISCSDSENIIVRYIRVRAGMTSSRGSKSINISNGKNMIFDHVSASWGRWDTVGITQKSENITLQHCLFAEAIDPQRFGALIDSSNGITVYGTLWMNNQSRSPKIKANMQYINNVVYNWGASGVPGGHSAADWYQDVVNNVFIKGPSSSDKFFDMFASTDNVYQAGNIADLVLDGKLDGRAVEKADYRGETPPTFHDAPSNKPPVPVTVLSPTAAYERIVASVGASLVRDATDKRFIEQLTSLGTKGAIIKSESEVGGQPPVEMAKRNADFDSDGDGMADAWEKAHGLNPNDASDAVTLDESGYSNIERYLNSLVP